jgi:hypothetical protein
MAASRLAFAKSNRTCNMTICPSLPADFCLRRAVRAQVSGDRQTPPVRYLGGRPSHGSKSLIARMFEALRSARMRFFPCFSGENRGETGALVPLFAASVSVISSTRQTKLACVERGVSLPFRYQGKNFPCRRSLATAPLGHQPSGRYGPIANEPGSARCRFANLPCRQGKLEKAGGIAAVRGGEPAGHSAILAPRLQPMVVSRERNRCEKPAFPSLLAPSDRPFTSLLLSLSRSRHRIVSGCFERPYRRRAGADEIFFPELRERRVL